MTAAQLREVIGRLIEAGRGTTGAPDILLVMDAGYDVTRLAHLLSDLPLELIGRLRSDRVMLRNAGEPRSMLRGGRPRLHGIAFTFAKPESWHELDTATRTESTRYGKVEARAWGRMHQRLQKRGPWVDHEGEIPITHGTLVRLQVEHLPGEREAKPLWLWSSATGIDTAHLDRIWRTFLRRFDLEHTFRLLKLRRPWERQPPAAKLTPTRVRGGSATSARRPPPRPVCQNPPDPAPDDHRVRRTAGRHPPRRRQDRQTRTHAPSPPRRARLKIKVTGRGRAGCR